MKRRACAHSRRLTRAVFQLFALAAATALLDGCGPLSGDAVTMPFQINEFMASNTDSLIVDEHGEPEDWIELYNSSSVAFSLDGLYLTDDSTDLSRFALPDTTIPAHGFFVVWADNDTNQGNDHAPFKLSADDGEEIILCNEDGEVLDRIQFFIGMETWGEVLYNESYGRVSDGASTWCVQKTPTPGAANSGP